MRQAFESYLINLELLDVLIAKEEGNSPEADTIREYMDLCWNNMTEQEQVMAKQRAGR